MTLKVLFLTRKTALRSLRRPKPEGPETAHPGNPPDKPRHDTPERKKRDIFFTIFYLLNAE